MKPVILHFLVLVVCLSVAACSPSPESDAPDSTSTLSLPEGTEASIRVVTWNVEHLAFPIEAGCRPRTGQEIADLKAYARSLQADVVALQEVASREAVALLFPEDEWQIFMSDRPDSEPYTCREGGQPSTQQKVAFAVRNGVDVKDVEALDELGLDSPGLRYGMELTVESALGPIAMLNVHMKSGCFVDDFSRSDDEDCVTYAEQAPILDGWIEEQERGSVPYLALGDFNHRLSAPYNAMTRLLGENSDGSPSTLAMPTASLIGCHPWYPAPIDHILAGKFQAPTLTLTPAVHPFEDMDPEAMLSDHCAVSLTLSHAPLPLSNSVTWQTTSKEYRFLTTSIYQDAAEQLREATLPEGPWAVAMDIDETVLDNSAYQVALDQSGRSFTPETWAEWVASEQATLVPGAAAFIQTVVDLGGHLAFITNRDRPQDGHTWSNMLALDLPISKENACLMGRSPADRASVDGRTYINDKDLRRQQIEAGTASCHDPASERHTTFPAATIIMQVGDNIEDFAGVTQESADVAALQDQELPFKILLPNPMYGSW